MVRIDKAIIRSFLKKKCRILLTINAQYTGEVIDILDDSILFIDKYGKTFPISISTIAVIYPTDNDDS